VNASSDVDAFIDAHGRSYVELTASTPSILGAMADHVAWEPTVMLVAAIYPLEQVREAPTELAEGHPHGKIVLSTVLSADAEALRPT
jgi:hypothetical protein